MELSERKKKILRAVIDHYVESAEPVGSKIIASDPGITFSSATIRNEMAELEAMGLLEQPHTSAGRIPTSLGYRVYVNELMERQKLSIQEAESINSILRNKVQQLDRLLNAVSNVTAQLTNYPTYALTTLVESVTISRYDFIYVDSRTVIIVTMLGNSEVKNKLVHLSFPVEREFVDRVSTVFNSMFTGIPEEQITDRLIRAAERAVGDAHGFVLIASTFAIETLMNHKMRDTVVTGTSNLFEHPEYRNINKAQKLISYLSDSDTIRSLPAPENEAIKITIGSENLAEELKDSSVVVARYDAGDNMQGLIGVVGPTRMDYSGVAAKLSYIANGLSWLISGGEALPGIADKCNEDG